MLRTWQSMVGTLAVAGALLVGAAPAALADPAGSGGGGPDPTTAPIAEKVSAEVLPAVMYVQVDVHAWVRDLSTGIPYSIPDRTLSCTGFAVGSNGVVATAGHCVNDQDLLHELALGWADQDAAAGYDPVASYAYSMSNYKLEGEVGNTPPDRKITVFRATGAATDPGMLAQIVDQKSNAQGDVALLKTDTTNLPTVEVVPSDAVNTGTPIMSAGYPAARDAVVDASRAPTWKDGTVSSRQNSAGVPFLEITSEMGRGMSGGPTVNQQGQVVGINSMGARDGGDSFNFVAPSSALLDMMARNGIRSEAGPVDLAYRAGLDAYFSGHYSDAADGFQRVLDLQPGNTMASQYRSKALAAHEQFGDKGSLGLVGWLLVGGAALVLVVGTTIVLLVRRARRRRGDGAGAAVTVEPPFAGTHGPGVAVPAPRDGGQPLVGGPEPVGTVVGPLSPPVGFPAPPAGDRSSTAATPEDAAGGTATLTTGRFPHDPFAGDTRTRFCPTCGTPRPTGSSFCGQCGHRM